MVAMLGPLAWAQRQFGEAELGDKRRTRRAVAYAAAAAGGPSLSVPRQCGGKWKQTKGAYRLFDQAQVSLDRLQEPHRRLTRAEASKRRVVLWPSDTTTLSYDHPATQGLGATATQGQGQGMLLHSTMAVDVSGGMDASPFVLGLGHQQVWTRRGGGGNNNNKRNKTKLESDKWASGVAALGQVPAGVRWMHVGDAESDCWEAIDACRLQQNMGFVIRACQNRRVLAGHGSGHGSEPSSSDEQTTLFDLLREQPAMGNKKLWVRSRPERPAGWATLAVSALAVTVLPPGNWPDKPHRKGQPKPEPIRCWALRIYQINTPAGQRPIEWMILTDEPLGQVDAALLVAFWYSCRWLIEEYHKCLKTGCGIEERQLQAAYRLQSLLGILSVVAVRLLQLKHQAKVNATAKASSIVPMNYVQTLAAHLKLPPRRKLTAHQFWIETARLGGFLARKGDGDPGWLTLWHGWQHLELLTAGFDLARGIKSKCG